MRWLIFCWIKYDLDQSQNSNYETGTLELVNDFRNELDAVRSAKD